MKTLYDVLNAHADDDAESVREAFRKAVKANHPDLNAGDPDAQSRFEQIVRANAILRDPELRALYDQMLELEEQPCRPQSKLVAISNTARNIPADRIFVFLLALGLAGGAYRLFLSKASDVTALETVTVAAVPPLAPVDVAEQLKAVGDPKSSAAALRARVDIAANVKTTVGATLERPKPTSARPALRPIIADEPRDELEGVDAVASNDQAPTANSHETPLLAGLAVGTRSPDKRPLDTRPVQLHPSTPAVQALDREQGAMLLQQGRELLRSGDIAGARLAFQRLADAGDVEAALALGKTFDRRYLARHYVIGVVGDEAKARAWYQRAMELGSTEAKNIMAQMATK